MKHRLFYTVLVGLLLASMALTACGKQATPTATAVPPAATVKPTEKPTEVPTEAVAPTEAPTATTAPMVETPLWSKELKQAIAASIDREAMVDRVFEGRNTPAYSMVPPSYPYATEPFLDKYGTRDLEQAKKLLTGLGYTADKPFEMELWYPPEHYGTTTADVMQVLKEQLEETGLIKVTLKSQNWAEYVDSFVAGKLPVFMLGWFPDFVDPDTWLSPFSSCIQSPGQGVNYCNPDMDALLTKAASSADPAVREETYKQIGLLYAEEVPTIPLWWEPEFITNRPGVENIKIGAPFVFNYNILSFGADAKPAAGNPDTIIIGTTDEVNSLDADDSYATHDWEILKNTGVTLLEYEPGTANLIPGAAEALPTISSDGKTYTYKLRQDLKFADGTPVTANDYVYSFKRLSTLEGSQVAGLILLYVDSVEATDDYTVVYHLKDSFAFFPAVTATAPFVPVDPKIFKEDAILQFPEKLDGIGPYRMVSYKPGEQMVLEANPYYFGEAPKIKTVIIKYFADPTTMSNAVEKGDIDIAWRVLGAVEATRLMTVAGLTVTKIDAPTLRYLVFNHTFMVAK